MLLTVPVWSALATGSAILTAGFWQVRQQRRERGDKFRRGLALMRHIQSLIELSQKHRGSSNAVASGNEELRGTLTTLQREIDAATGREISHSLQQFEQWQTFTEHWSRLQARVNAGDLSSTQLIRQHNRLIEALLFLLDDVTRHYSLHTLMLDNMTRVSEVILDTLRASETIGQTRAVGAGICARGQAHGSEAILLNFLRISMQSQTQALSRELGLINNSELQQSLRAASTNIAHQSDVVLQLLDEQILNRTTVTVDAADYFRLASQPLDALSNIFIIIVDYSARNYAKLC
jgi:hypothetical protein